MIKTIFLKIPTAFIDTDGWSFQFAASFFAAIFGFVSKYVFGDAQFGIAMLLLITIDTVFGVWRARKEERFDIGEFFNGTIGKVIMYAMFVSAFWIVTQIKVSTGDNPLFWADWIGYSWLAGKEIVSITRNADAIKPGWVPAWIMDKVNGWNQTGKI